MHPPPLNLPLPSTGGGERGGGDVPIGLIYVFLLKKMDLLAVA